MEGNGYYPETDQVSSGDNWQNKGQKRGDGSQGGGPYPKKKKNPQQGLKNPVSFINEIRPDTDFVVADMSGPTNTPTFTVSLEFDGETYKSSARSKKIAKRLVAEAALKVYLQTAVAKQLGYTESQIDFGGDQEGATTGNSTTTTKGSTGAAAGGGGGGGGDKKAAADASGCKNPVMYLNEIRKDAVYDLKEESGNPHNKKFIMRVTVCGQQFEGIGQNKKIAKSEAAREAIKALGLISQE